MNENDPYGKPSQAPILSPETFAPKHTESSVPEDKVTTPKEAQDESTKKIPWKKILIESLTILLLIGAVTSAVFAATGGFPGQRRKTRQSVSEESLDTTESSEKEKTTKSTKTSKGAKTTDPAGPHSSVVSLSQITDEQFKIMDEEAREHIRNVAVIPEDAMPDQVTIDDMNYIGMLCQQMGYIWPETDERYMIQMVYQVQVTDNTGSKPVKRQYFWMDGFFEVNQDGVINPLKAEGMWSSICYENWTATGCLTLDLLLNEAELRCPIIENGIDESRIKPFEGGSDEAPALIKSIDQITVPMERDLERSGQTWLGLANIFEGAQSNGMRVDKIEYAGLVLALSKDETINRIFVIYRFEITDLNQTPPESRTVYWYGGFNGQYDGQIMTACIENREKHPVELSDWVDAPGTIEDLRKFLKEYEAIGWTFGDNLDKYAKSS